MKGIAFLFFVTAAIAVLLGMFWGIHMSASGDHSMAPAHAHLNLIGWVTMGLFGLYYHTVPAAAESKLARIHYPLALAGLVTVVPGIVMALREQSETLAKIGSLLTALSMLLFVVVVITTRKRA